MSEPRPRERLWARAIQLSFSRCPDPQEQCQATQLVVWSHYISVVLWVLSPSGTSPVGSGEEVLCWGPSAAPQRNLFPEDLVWRFSSGAWGHTCLPAPPNPGTAGCLQRVLFAPSSPPQASLVAQMVKRLLTTQEAWVQSLGRGDPLEKDMATHLPFLPGKFHGWRSLVGYSPWGRKDLDTTERLHFLSVVECLLSMREVVGSMPTSSSFGEGNGNPLQYSCLENSMDGGAWWVTIQGVAKSRTWLSDFTTTSLLQTL